VVCDYRKCLAGLILDKVNQQTNLFQLRLHSSSPLSLWRWWTRSSLVRVFFAFFRLFRTFQYIVTLILFQTPLDYTLHDAQASNLFAPFYNTLRQLFVIGYFRIFLIFRRPMVAFLIYLMQAPYLVSHSLHLPSIFSLVWAGYSSDHADTSFLLISVYIP